MTKYHRLSDFKARTAVIKKTNNHAIEDVDKREPLTQPVGMSTSPAMMEDNVEVPHQANNRSSTPPGYLSKSCKST